jgi:hypothetical protein
VGGTALRKGYRGRFGMYVPPLLEALGKAELTHEPRNNRGARCPLSDLRSRAPSSRPLAARAAFVAFCEEMRRQPINQATFLALCAETRGCLARFMPLIQESGAYARMCCDCQMPTLTVGDNRLRCPVGRPDHPHLSSN